MKTVKRVLIVLAAIAALVIVIGLFLPSKTHVERTAQVDAPPEVVFTLLNNLHVFHQWSPWAKIDPNAQYSFSGPETGVGSKMSWSSEDPDVGTGTQEIVSAEPNSEVRLILRMQGWEPAQVGFLIKPEGTATSVTWEIDFDNGMNVFYRYMGVLAMDNMLGAVFEQGLADFKSIAENQSAPPAAQIETQVIPYEVDGQIYQGYLAYDPAMDKTPGVLVVHEWWGLNDYARKRAEMLAELGYTAFALDMYGDGKQAVHPKDAMEFSQQVMRNPDAAIARFKAALEVLKEHGRTDPEQIAAIGYCFGGGVVLNMARAGLDLDAVVSFHGSLQSVVPVADNVTTRVLVLSGADDPFTTAEQKEAFKQEMEQAGIQYEFIEYPGAVHSFTNPGADELGKKFDLPLAYNAEADRKSWQKMQELFQDVFSD